VLYRFDRQGQFRKQLELKVKNTDWEALSSDGTFLYLADTGNNAGQRASLQIHKIPLDWRRLAQPYQPETIEISLPQQTDLQAYQHDLDFEAMVYQQGFLWLISKSWASGQPKVYRLDPKVPQQQLGQGIPLPSPGFLVTDASTDAETGDWWLVGYTNPYQAIWAYLTGAGFHPQIARYDQQGQLLQLQDLPGNGQVEGLCIDQQRQLWITEEGSSGQKAKLTNTGLSSQSN
jgi:hypothetical protein